MKAIVFINLQILFATRAVLKIEEYSRIFPSFRWEIFAHVTRLDQSRASENICWIITTGISRQWPAARWLDSPIGRALERYRKGHVFPSRSGLNFFSLLFHSWFSCAYNCDDQSCLDMFLIYSIVKICVLVSNGIYHLQKPSDGLNFGQKRVQKWSGTMYRIRLWSNSSSYYSFLDEANSSNWDTAWDK